VFSPSNYSSSPWWHRSFGPSCGAPPIHLFEVSQQSVYIPGVTQIGRAFPESSKRANGELLPRSHRPLKMGSPPPLYSPFWGGALKKGGKKKGLKGGTHLRRLPHFLHPKPLKPPNFIKISTGKLFPKKNNNGPQKIFRKTKFKEPLNPFLKKFLVPKTKP